MCWSRCVRLALLAWVPWDAVAPRQQPDSRLAWSPFPQEPECSPTPDASQSRECSKKWSAAWYWALCRPLEATQWNHQPQSAWECPLGLNSHRSSLVVDDQVHEDPLQPVHDWDVRTLGEYGGSGSLRRINGFSDVTRTLASLGAHTAIDARSGTAIFVTGQNNCLSNQG